MASTAAIDQTQTYEIATKFQETSMERQRNREQGHEEKNDDVDITEHTMPVEEVEALHNTRFASGLSDDEVRRRLEVHGENRLSPPPDDPEWKKFLRHLTGFFSLLLWAGSLLCFVSYGLDSDSADNLGLGIVLAIVVFLTGCFSYYQESKSAAIMEGFNNILPDKTRVRRNGNTIEIDATLLVPGDIVFMKSGDKVPADTRCVEVTNFKVDNSSLTGESDPQRRVATVEREGEEPLEAKNIAFYGTLCQEGSCVGIVIRTGDGTVIGKIAKLVQSGEEVPTPIGIEIEHFIKLVSAVAIVLGLSFLLIALLKGLSPIDSLVFMIGIIVSNVPEGLLATVTVALTLTAQQMAEKQVLVKNLESVETLGSTTVIASDKTGTLTQNRMTVAHLYYDGNIYIPSEGNVGGSFNRSHPSFRVLHQVGVLCNRATFIEDEENLSKPVLQRQTDGDASESAFIKFFEPLYPIVRMREENRKLAEIPFKSKNKYQVSIHAPGNDDTVDRLFVMKGAPERIWDRCDTFLLNGEHVPKEQMEASYRESLRTLMMRGERVLGCAYSTLPIAEFGPGFEYDTEDETVNFPMRGLTFVGLISLMDPPRSAVPGAVLSCQRAGIKVVMVTGDHPDTAEAIAKQVNIIRDTTRRDLAMARGVDLEDISPEDPEIQALVITGTELKTYTPEMLDDALDYEQIVFARTSPAQKHQIVGGLQKKTHIKRGYPAPGKEIKHVVAVTGDGVNDSPALKLADIGVAMGIAGSAVAKNAADMILLDDNFASIVNGVEEGRLIFDNLKKSIAYTLSSNIPEITPFIFFLILGLPLPLPIVLILCIDLGTDLVPAISLAYERKEADIMMKPPRNAKTDRLVTWKLISFSYLQIGVIQALAGFYAYFVVLNDYGFSPSFVINKADVWEDSFVNETAEGFLMWDEDGEFIDEVGTCQYPDAEPCRDPELALAHAQTAFFVSIVLVQWADVLICKTRSLSIKQQGMFNKIMNIGLIEETLLALCLCYIPVLHFLGTESIRFEHWLPPLPFTCLIFIYDEFRKYFLRTGGPTSWVYRATYY